jgi:hypothetical protein
MHCVLKLHLGLIEVLIWMILIQSCLILMTISNKKAQSGLLHFGLFRFSKGPLIRRGLMRHSNKYRYKKYEPTNVRIFLA